MKNPQPAEPMVQITAIAECLQDKSDCHFGVAATGRGGDQFCVVLIPSSTKEPKLRSAIAAAGALGGSFLIEYDPKNGCASLVKVRCYGPRIAEALEKAEIVGRKVGNAFDIAADKLDDLLNAMLLGERPVLGGRVHCIVPMQFGTRAKTSADNANDYKNFRKTLLDKAQQPDSGIAIEHSQKGRHYFLPHTHQLLISGATRVEADAAVLDEQVISIHSLAIDILQPRLSVTRQWPERTISACVESARLHLYTERTIALEYTLCLPALEAKGGLVPGKALWSDIVLAGPAGWQGSVAAWLDYVEGARHIYSGFKADAVAEPAKSFTSQLVGVVPPVAALAGWDCTPPDLGDVRLPIKFALEYFMRLMLDGVDEAMPADLSDLFEIRCDDRARIVQSLAISGDRPTAGVAAERLAALEARFAVVDEYGPDFFYDRKFAEDETAHAAYDRFRTGGNRYFATDHSFGHMGFGSFAHSPVYDDHMPNLYRRMALLLHLNGAVINGMLREVGDALQGWDAAQGAADSHADQLARLHRRFLKFFNLNWFNQVSSQMQGIELYDLMRTRSQAQRELPLLDDEVTRTSAYLTTRREQRKEGHDRFFVALLAIAALLAGLPALVRGDVWPVLGDAINRLTQTPGFAQGWSSELAGLLAIWMVAGLDWLGLLDTPIRDVGRAQKVQALPTMLVPLTVTSVLPFVPTLPWPLLPYSLSGSLLWIALSVAAMIVGFNWAWKQTTRHARPEDDLRHSLYWLYLAFLTLFMVLTGLHATGIVGG